MPRKQTSSCTKEHGKNYPQHYQTRKDKKCCIQRERTKLNDVIVQIGSMKGQWADILRVWIKANEQRLQRYGHVGKEKGKEQTKRKMER